MMTRPWLAKDVVRFVGEPVVAIVTETAAQGEDAAEAVFVDYEPTDAVVDLDAAATNETLVYPEVGTNVGVDFVAFQMMQGVTDDTFFDGCDVVVRQRIINNRVALRSRPFSCGVVDDGTRLLDLEPVAPRHHQNSRRRTPRRDRRVITPDVGGFASRWRARQKRYAVAAKRSGVPCDGPGRTENMISSAAVVIRFCTSPWRSATARCSRTA
jgi:carbon-monoxide dehydrogenase large subunit